MHFAKFFMNFGNTCSLEGPSKLKVLKSTHAKSGTFAENHKDFSKVYSPDLAPYMNAMCSVQWKGPIQEVDEDVQNWAQEWL